MPFKSKAQRSYLHKFQPQLAKEWESKYPVKKKLPEKLNKSVSEKRRNSK